MELKALNPKLTFAIRIAILTLVFLIAWNQYVSWKYKAEFLGTPCELCVKLNGHYAECFDDAGFILKDSQGNILAKGKEAKEMLKNQQNAPFPQMNWSIILRNPGSNQ